MNNPAKWLNAGRKQKQEKQEINSKNHAINLLNTKMQKLIQEKNKLLDEIKILKTENENLKNQLQTTNPILLDLLKHQDKKKSEYSPEIISLGLKIKNESKKAYNLLVRHLGFPTEYYIEKLLSNSSTNLPECLTDISSLGTLLSSYKDSNHLSTFDATLAVDALYFTPEVEIDNEGNVSGMIFSGQNKNSLPKELFSLFADDPGQFAEFLSRNSGFMIKAAFVFQIQPFDCKLKPFVVHIKSATNGKANNTIVELLQEIKRIAKNRNINIRSFAFDGDNAYLNLHIIYYESYIHHAIRTHRLNLSHSRTMRVVSDYLHIIKRLRYRLLSSSVHSGFTDDPSSRIDIPILKTILKKVSPLVWNNEKYTKMHDSLPLQLFNLDHLLNLFFAKYFQAVAFWFPISTSLYAIHQPELGFNTRYYLLQTAAWFLIFYQEELANTEKPLKQRKTKENLDVAFYTKELLIEFTNTIVCHLQLMTIMSNYSFDRNSTTPLEHKFGNSRLRARDVHTLKRFIRNISLMQNSQSDVLKELKHFQKELKVPGRVNSFGVTVEKKDLQFSGDVMLDGVDSEQFMYSPQVFAKSVLAFSNFHPDLSEEFYDYEAVLNWGFNFLYEIQSVFPDFEQKKRRYINQNFYALGVKKPGTRGHFSSQYQPLALQKRRTLIHELFIDAFGPNYTKDNIIKALLKVKEHDQNGSMKVPNADVSVEKLIDWIAENFFPIFEFLKLILTSTKEQTEEASSDENCSNSSDIPKLDFDIEHFFSDPEIDAMFEPFMFDDDFEML